MYAIRSYYDASFSAANATPYKHTITPPTEFLGRKIKLRWLFDTGSYAWNVYVYKNGDMVSMLSSNYQDFEMQITASDTWALWFYATSGTQYGSVLTRLRITSYNVCYTKLLRDI